MASMLGKSSTAKTSNNGYTTHRQTNHGIRTGVGFRF